MHVYWGILRYCDILISHITVHDVKLSEISGMKASRQVNFFTQFCRCRCSVSLVSSVSANIITLIDADTDQSLSTPGMYQLLLLTPDGDFLVKLEARINNCASVSVTMPQPSSTSNSGLMWKAELGSGA